MAIFGQLPGKAVGSLPMAAAQRLTGVGFKLGVEGCFGKEKDRGFRKYPSVNVNGPLF